MVDPMGGMEEYSSIALAAKSYKINLTILVL